MRYTILLGAALFLLSACGVSNKNVLAMEQSYKTEIGTLNEQLRNSRDEITRMQLQIAERKGENTALLATQDKYLKRLDELEEELDKAQNQALTKQSSLGDALKAKNDQILSLENQIVAIRGALKQEQETLQQIAKEFQDSLAKFPVAQYSVEVRNGKIVLALTESLLFKSGVSNRIEPNGQAALKAIGTLLNANPVLLIQVLGHTDNQTASRKNQDSWDFTSLRAATVVRSLIEAQDLGANRVISGGRGEFDPITSNETSEGQSRNRRVELSLFFPPEDLQRKITQLAERK
ncbi:MAG TPA: OmpA family protein [Haliscomenobacter sp.]|nr:OmpA family protein [Haliscomenobacter sp.]